MSWQKYFRPSFIFLVIAATLGHCTSASDPGLDKRYPIEFTSPTAVAGKIFHWASMPVKLRYNACAVNGCTTGVENAVKSGIEFWQKNASLFGEVQVAYAEPADVEVKYVNSLGGTLIGVCSGSLAQNSQTKQFVILTPLTLTIATTVNGQALNESDIKFVAAHEMGHCLGLWSHSPTNGDLMYFQLTSKTGYTSRDLNSLRWLYSQTSDVGALPLSALGQAHALTGEVIVSPPLNSP